MTLVKAGTYVVHVAVDAADLAAAVHRERWCVACMSRWFQQHCMQTFAMPECTFLPGHDGIILWSGQRRAFVLTLILTVRKFNCPGGVPWAFELCHVTRSESPACRHAGRSAVRRDAADQGGARAALLRSQRAHAFHAL